MKLLKIIYLAVLANLLTSCVSLNIHTPTNAFVPGVWNKGDNTTEPRPAQGKYMRVTEGGFAISGNLVWANLYLDLSLPQNVFMKVEFENPLDPTKSFIETAEIQKSQATVTASHGNISGLRMMSYYQVQVTLYSDAAMTNEIDQINQKIRAYVDSRGETVLVSGTLNSALND